MDNHKFFMQQALAQANLAYQANEVPVGAVVVQENKIIAVGHNCSIKQLDPTAHAEIIALLNASKVLNNYRLIEVSIYVTLEPCVMCFGALLQARVKQLIFGASDPKFGALGGFIDLTAYRWNHKFNVIKGVLEKDSVDLLQEFFKNKRKGK